jgi:hypothetical protein
MLTTGLTTQAKTVMLSLLAQRNVKLAIYTGSADIGPDTRKYTPQGEAEGRGYKPGGVKLGNPRVWEDRGSACLTWDSPTLPNATLSGNGYAIYDADTKDMYFVGSWDGTYSSSEGPFNVRLSSDMISIS